MSRAPNEKVNNAYELYKKGNQLIYISRELDISYSTVLRWKKIYDWEKEPLKNQKKYFLKKDNKKKINKKVVAEQVKEALDNEDLTNKQKLFCIVYSKCFNATKAYQKVYHCSYKTAMVCGSRLLANVKVKKQIDSLTQIQFNKETLKRGVLQKYIDIAFADITEYVQFGEEEVQLYDKDGKAKYNKDGGLMTKKYRYIKLEESKKIDGTLISEVSESTSGIKFKLHDKMKALEFLTKHCNILDDENKSRLDSETKKLQNEKLRAELNKIADDEDEEFEDDGFLEALKVRTAEVWSNE